MRKGFVFSLMAILLAFSLASFLTTYRVFLSEVELTKPRDTGLGNHFLFVGDHVEDITDIDVKIYKPNRSISFINITDQLPRAHSYNDSLAAYETFVENNINSSYSVDVNFSELYRNTAFDFSAIEATYNYSDHKKTNASLIQRIADTDFVGAYDIRIIYLDSSVAASSITSSTNSGDLNVSVVSGSQTFSSRIDRTKENRVTVNTTGNQWVNITIGKFAGYNASVFINSTAKIQLILTATILNSELND